MTEPAIRYLRSLGIAFVAILALCVGFDVLVDPYRLLDLVDIPGFNVMKPFAHDQEDISKPYALLRAAPATVLIGSSRANGSLDPDVLENLPGPKNIYNFSISAFGVPQIRRFLQHALAAGGVKTVVLTLEFSEFLDYREPPSPAPLIPLDRLLVDPDGKPNRWRFIAELADFDTAFMTLDALTDSVRTILSQDPANGTETARGWLIKDQMREVRQEGNHMLFLEKTRSNAAVTARFPKQLYPVDDPMGNFAEFNRMIALCRQYGVDFKVILPPFHAYLLELYRQNGLWPLLEDWKRTLTAAAAAANRANPGAPPVEIWDFTDYDRWTMDPVSPPADHRPMPWYWDTAHYRPTLGELMWRRIFYPTAAGELAELGEKLDPATIEARLVAIRARQEAAMAGVDADLRGILGGATPSRAIDERDLSGERE